MIDPSAPDAAKQVVVSLAARMRADGVRFARKAESELMQKIAVFLEGGGYMSRSLFLQNTFTTIDGTVYYPGGAIGEPWPADDGFVWTPDEQAGAFLHEYMHCRQPAAQGGNLAYDANYLLHRITMIHDESEARVAQAWWYHMRYGHLPDFAFLSQQLRGYGVTDPAELEHSRTILALSGETIEAGILPNAAAELGADWIAAEAPWLPRHVFP